MQTRKCEVAEFEDISSILHPSPNAKLHGVVTSVSPMKKGKSCSYFDGEISDGKGSMRMFGFDSGVRRKLIEHQSQNDAVSLSYCEIKHARQGDQLEVLVNKFTEIEKRTKEFNVTKLDKKCDEVVELCQLQCLAAFQCVVVEVKVVHINDATEVSGGEEEGMCSLGMQVVLQE